MSLDDIIVDHESNQCLFVCAKCGAEYVTRDMLAMHMMDSARAGMCIETDTVSSIQNINNNNNNNSNHKMSTNEESVISEQSSTAPKLNQSSNMFEYSQPPYASLPNWIGERTEPIFNMLFNQLTLPHIYSLQNATLNANTNNNNNNNMHSANLMSLNHKIFSALEESLPSSFRGFRNASSSSTASSSITDVQKDEDGIQSLLMNSKYQTNNNLGQNVKMNFIHSLKVNKNDMFTSLATKDKIRMSSGKSNSNLSEYYKGRLKQISSEVNHSQRCTSPANPWIKSFGNQGSSNSSSSSSSSITSTGAISKPFNSPADTNIKSNNGNTKCTATLQSKSQTIVDRSANDQEGFKITYTNTQMKVCDVARSSRSTKCKDAKNLKAIKRSRSLPSPRTLLSQQMCSESTPSRVNENSVVEKTNDISPCDEMLHKTRRDRKCYKRSGYKNLRKLVNYNRSKFKMAQNSHILSQITNCYNPDKTDVHSANCNDEEAVVMDVQHDSKHVTSLDDGNNQKIKAARNSQLTFPYICDYCQIGFVQQALFCLHMGMHCVNNPLKCNMCARNCLNVYDFISHTLHF